MSRTITINGTDRSSAIRLDSFSFTESASRGEVGIGGFAVDDAAALSYYDATLGSGPASYWRLSETSSTFADTVGGISGTVVGGMTRGVTGALDPADTNAAVDLDGTTGYITFGDNYDFAGTAAFSYAAWVYRDANGVTPSLVYKASWYVYINHAGGVVAFVRSSAGTDVATAPMPAAGAWAHVAVTYNGAQMIVYVNGVAGTPLASTRSLPGNATLLQQGGAASLADFFFNGKLDESAIWSRVLTADEILQLYRARLAGVITIPAMKAVTVDESAAATVRVFTGYTHNRTTQRGPNKVAGQREWDVEVADINTLSDDYVLSGAGADRGEETDYARVTWLLTTVFNTTGGVTAGVVPNSNTVTMDAVDYRGRTPREVLNECAEMASKNWFLYRYSTGPLLYYDLATGTSLSSTARISDVYADVDSAVTWAPATPPTVKRSPDRIYSTVRFKYKRGKVTVTNAATVTAYRTREKSILDLSVKTAAKATVKANAFLAGAANELVEVSQIAVRLPAANVNDIRAGQRVQIKLTRHGIASFTYYRVVRRTVEALGGGGGVSDVEYMVTLTLASDILPSANGSRGGDAVWEEKSNATDDDASVIIDRGGITVTNGAITVTNAASTVIIDGTSNMFKIAASGTLTHSIAVDTSDGNVVSLTGLGTLSEPRAILAYLRDGTSAADAAAVNQQRYVGVSMRVGTFDLYAASASGGSPTVHFAATQTAATAYSKLSATPTGTAEVGFSGHNASAATRYYYMKYYVLQESAI